MFTIFNLPGVYPISRQTHMIPYEYRIHIWIMNDNYGSIYIYIHIYIICID
jgi:hypothetical protein